MPDHLDLGAMSNAELDERASLPAYLRYGVTGRDLMATEFPDPVYIVEGLITTGLTLVCGAPKVRKSWLALDIADAVAEGGEALSGLAADHGSVLVLALEDPPRRLKKRLGKMGVSASSERIRFCTAWPTGNDAVKEIEVWAANSPNPKLVIIDVFVCIRSQTGREVSYQDDYRSLKALQVLANKLEIAILAIHHTRKQPDDDPLAEVSGTTGLAGAADTILVLRRDNTGSAERRATLFGRGRDLEDDVELALQFDNANCRWRVLGQARAVADTAEQQEILDLLTEPMKVKDIASLVGKSVANVSKMLGKMARAGFVSNPCYGCYGPVELVEPVEAGRGASTTSTTSTTPQNCPRCEGEGCEWCGSQ